MDARASAVTKVTVTPVIVRACVVCGGPRAIGKSCAGCGNTEPAITHDLGVQSAWHRSRWMQLRWNLIGKRLAARRARQANKES